MKNVSPEKKEAVLKTLAIFGFLFIIVAIAWISVKAVSLAPNAFSSLASIAESINQYKGYLGENDDELELIKDEDEISSGNPLVISWIPDQENGSYTFTYDCIDGVSLDLVDDEGLRRIDCDTSYDVGNTDTITVVAESDKAEAVTVTYTVTFIHDAEPNSTRSGSDAVAVNPDEDRVPGQPATDSDVVVQEPNGTDELPNLGAPEPAPTPAPRPTSRPTPTPTYTYTLPVSDPNGHIDLGTLYLGVGTIVNNTFKSGTISRNDDGAFQFEVKNYGTKTSETWTYTVSLPDGESYTSPKQTALKPNERAVITLGFPVGSDTSHTFKVTIKTDTDKNNSNNTFSKNVSFSR